MIGKYEKGKTTPGGEVLFLLAKAGLDVDYILTGVRAQAAAISPRDLALLDNVRECAEEDRRAIERLALRVSEAKHTEVSATKLRKAG